MLRTLAESSSEFRQLSEHLKRTGAVLSRDRLGSGERTVQKALGVVRIERILMLDAEGKYRNQRMKMFETRGASRCELHDCVALRPDLGHDLDLGFDEFLLYHGCRACSIDGILREGFDPCRSGERAGRFFGCGTYFADVAAKADTYVDAAADGMRCLIVAQVCLGKALRALRTMPRFQPDEEDEAESAFDSVVGEDREHGGVLDHREYIVYKGSQAMPRYLVWYRHSDDCKCFRCRLRMVPSLPPLPLPAPASSSAEVADYPQALRSFSARAACTRAQRVLVPARQGSRAASWERRNAGTRQSASHDPRTCPRQSSHSARKKIPIFCCNVRRSYC